MTLLIERFVDTSEEWDEFEITWAASLREQGTIAPNMAMYWALIERAFRDGLRRFNFGRCGPNSLTHRSKTQRGAVDELLYWYRASGMREAATPIPLAFTNAVGLRLVLFLP